MKINIRGDKVVITESIAAYINNKVKKLTKYFTDTSNIEAKVLVRVQGHYQIIEVTIPLNNFILRSEERHADLYAAIDLVVDKLERQITKNKEKLQSKKFKNLAKMIKVDAEVATKSEEKIVRRKIIEMKPMSEEEAILQLNMIGHDFFVYKDELTNQVCVLYKRKDGNYGVITTD